MSPSERSPSGASTPAKKKTATARRQKRSGPRRDEIIRVAAATFYEKGYESTSTQDIADEVGLLKGSLYYYISSKEDLLFEVIDEMHSVWTKNLERNDLPNEDALTRIWVMVYNNILGNTKMLLNSAIFARDFRSLSKRRQKRIVTLRDKHDEALRNMITDAQSDGAARTDLDVKITALAILTMCNNVYQWYRPEGPLPAEKVAESYADLAVASLAASPDFLTKARERALDVIREHEAAETA